MIEYLILGIKEVLTHLGVFMLCKSITVSLQTQKPKTNPEKIKKKMEVVLVIVNATEYIEKKTTQEPRKKEIVMEDCMRCCKQTMIYLYCIDVWYKKSVSTFDDYRMQQFKFCETPKSIIQLHLKSLTFINIHKRWCSLTIFYSIMINL